MSAKVIRGALFVQDSIEVIFRRVVRTGGGFVVSWVVCVGSSAISGNSSLLKPVPCSNISRVFLGKLPFTGQRLARFRHPISLCSSIHQWIGHSYKSFVTQQPFECISKTKSQLIDVAQFKGVPEILKSSMPSVIVGMELAL